MMNMRSAAYIGVGFVAVYLLTKSLKKAPVISTVKPVTTGTVPLVPYGSTVTGDADYVPSDTIDAWSGA